MVALQCSQNLGHIMEDDLEMVEDWQMIFRAIEYDELSGHYLADRQAGDSAIR